jgi:CheY-like chemotaxis protein
MRLSFPVPPAPADGEQPAYVGIPAPQRLRVLIVDDDPIVLRSLCDTLEHDGHLVTPVNSGQKGIEVFRAQPANQSFDAVITDLGMPHVDGGKVAGAVKGASPATPVILLTGWGQRLEEEGDLPAHVDRVLAKPPKLHELREALAWCVQTRSASQ